ncbi:MAG: GUN4 domain-containing protein [Scytolyngbya sp. HA4215-MV1]|jgi:hypothetical protein|nr:GUN4 domain-containing protein [Scytolyngbya sp. HA4215-MV1]
MTQPPENEPASTPPVPRPSTERRFVQRSLQGIARWSPLGGSSFAFASFLLKQDWATAGLLLPVTAVSGVWAAYSQNFVERLSEIYGERARNDADKLVAWMDSLNQTLQWQFSGFDQKYLKQQAKLCQEYTTEGFNPDKTAIPMLEQVFVPLQLSGYFAEDIVRVQDLNHSPEGLSIWDLIRRSRKDRTFRQMAIQAKGGFGKTTLMRHIALIYGEGKYRNYQAPKLIPFLLYLRDWHALLTQKNPPTLPDLITKHYLPSLSHSQPLTPPPLWVESLLREGDALVMLDGFDELAEGQRQRASHWISQQMQEFPRSTFIVTSRPAGYQDYVAKHPTAPLFVQKFSPDQQKKFVERWYLCQERCARSENQFAQAEIAATQKAQNLLVQLIDPNRPELREMAENPLLLNMLATFHRFDPGVELPKRRVELYKGICKLQLDDRPRARGIAMLLPLEKSLSILQSLALAMVNANRPTIPRSQILSLFQKHVILQQEEIDPTAFLQQMVQVSELLVEREPNEFEFPHLSFQGYFAASRLEQQGNKALSLVQQNWDKTWWRETILLYTAQLSPRLLTQVINQACNLGKEAAQLAYDCLREYRNPEKLDPTLAQELAALTGNVQNLRYQRLEESLKTGQWEEADEETYQLMITTVGKEVGQWFEPEDLLNFPCEELRTIGELWVKYSRGHFGFSVQKEIYLQCGGILDGKYDQKAWNKFCHAVGWKVKDKYVPVTYSTLALRGHLPGVLVVLGVDGWGGGGWLGLGWYFFSRIQACEV